MAFCYGFQHWGIQLFSPKELPQLSKTGLILASLLWGEGNQGTLLKANVQLVSVPEAGANDENDTEQSKLTNAQSGAPEQACWPYQKKRLTSQLQLFLSSSHSFMKVAGGVLMV